MQIHNTHLNTNTNANRNVGLSNHGLGQGKSQVHVQGSQGSQGDGSSLMRGFLVLRMLKVVCAALSVRIYG